MKTKTKSAKKPVAKKKVTKKPAATQIVIRQLSAKFTVPGSQHVVRVVEDCSPRLIKFDSIEQLNAWLFEFDFANHGTNPADSGTWVDYIFTDVQGEVFDMEELEQEQ